jgi:hypothetical protein
MVDIHRSETPFEAIDYRDSGYVARVTAKLPMLENQTVAFDILEGKASASVSLLPSFQAVLATNFQSESDRRIAAKGDDSDMLRF